MWIQKVYRAKDFTVTSAKLDTLDIARARPLTGILLRWHFVTGAGEAAALANECVINLVKNGSGDIFNCRYGEMIGIDNIIHPTGYKIADLGASVTGYYVGFIPFGRFLGDTDYFLDPTGFSSLDLKITQPVHTATATYNMDVILLCLSEPGKTPLGHFKITAKKDYTAAAAIEYVDLDTAYKYAGLMISELDGASTDILSVIGNVKLNANGGERIPLDEVGRDLFEEEAIATGHTPGDPLSTPLDRSNMVFVNFLKPWRGEEYLLDAPAFKSLKAEITGLAAGSVRVTGIELVK